MKRFVRLLATASLMATTAQPAFALPPPPEPVQFADRIPTVDLSVSDSTELNPDIARISIGVSNASKDKKLAMQENHRRMDAVLIALKSAGIGEKDIKTLNFWVSEDKEQTATGPRGRSIYSVSNSVEVTTHKIEALPDLVAAVYAAGANEIQTPDFDIENKTPILENLTRSATEKARARALFHAKLNGYSKIRLVSVTDSVDGKSDYAPAPMVLRAPPAPVAGTDDTPTPDLRPGKVPVSVNLSMSFEMTN